MNGSGLATWVVATLAVALGIGIGWWARRWLAAREASRQGEESDERFVTLFGEMELARREGSELRSANSDLMAQLDEQASLLATLQGQLTDHRAVADRFRADRDAARQELSEHEEGARRRDDEADAVTKALRAERDSLVDQLRAAEDRLEKAAESARAERSILTTELIDHRRRSTVAAEALDKVKTERDALERERLRLAAEVARREAEVRVAVVAQQAAFAEFRSELGALQAKAERADVLRGQLEDRENLLRAVIQERDRATRALLGKDGEIDRLRTELAGERAAAAQTVGRGAESARKFADLESRLAAAGRERDALQTAVTKSGREVETLREEIRERDTRFRALLEDRRVVVEAGLLEMARLRREIERASQSAPERQDDLKRISGIGPAIERLLGDLGIRSVRQIAAWSEDDVDAVARQLGAFRDRIRRDRWVDQAKAIVAEANDSEERMGVG